MFSVLDHRLLSRLGVVALVVGAVPTAQDILQGDKLRGGGAWAIVMLAGALAIYAAYQDKRYEEGVYRAVRDRHMEEQRRPSDPPATDWKLQDLQLVHGQLNFQLKLLKRAREDGRYPHEMDMEMRHWEQHNRLAGEPGSPAYRAATDAGHEAHRIGALALRRRKCGRWVWKRDKLDEAIAEVERGMAILESEMAKRPTASDPPDQEP